MKRSFWRPVRAAVIAFPLSAALVIQGCDSPTAPKFPPPIEEEEDTIPDEGVRTWNGRSAPHALPPATPGPFLACAERVRCR